MAPESLAGDIKFEHVNFRYGTRQRVLEDIDFTIKKGEKIAFVGESSQIIKKDLVEKIYVSPSKLYEEAEKDEFKKSLENKNRTDLPFAEINEIIERHKNFDFNNFGTIAHSYLETALKFYGQEIKVPYNNQDVSR